MTWGAKKYATTVALRKESVDRNILVHGGFQGAGVALRKESVDRNQEPRLIRHGVRMSLSARRAWIEIGVLDFAPGEVFVALRKESVDRNPEWRRGQFCWRSSLSARRAWIEISVWCTCLRAPYGRSPQGERG